MYSHYIKLFLYKFIQIYMISFEVNNLYISCRVNHPIIDTLRDDRSISSVLPYFIPSCHRTSYFCYKISCTEVSSILRLSLFLPHFQFFNSSIFQFLLTHQSPDKLRLHRNFFTIKIATDNKIIIVTFH